MAWNAVKALETHGDPYAIMVVLLGSGHVAFGLGATRQAAGWSKLPMATVIPVPLVDEEGEPARVRASYADYLWGLPAEADQPPYPSLGAALSDRKDAPHPVVTSVREGSPAAAAGLAGRGSRGLLRRRPHRRQGDRPAWRCWPSAGATTSPW